MGDNGQVCGDLWSRPPAMPGRPKLTQTRVNFPPDASRAGALDTLARPRALWSALPIKADREPVAALARAIIAADPEIQADTFTRQLLSQITARREQARDALEHEAYARLCLIVGRHIERLADLRKKMRDVLALHQQLVKLEHVFGAAARHRGHAPASR